MKPAPGVEDLRLWAVVTATVWLVSLTAARFASPP